MREERGRVGRREGERQGQGRGGKMNETQNSLHIAHNNGCTLHLHVNISIIYILETR